MFYVIMVDFHRARVLFLGITGPGVAQWTGGQEGRFASSVGPLGRGLSFTGCGRHFPFVSWQEMHLPQAREIRT